jgi:dephospho-CoA kinase
LLIGVTGGIAAGKSTVAQMLSRLGAPLIDADMLAREVASGGAVLQQIIGAFGVQILDGAGMLDRAALGRVVFSDSEARRRLEAITHPAIIAAAEERIASLRRAGHRLVLYEAALLVESGRYREMDLLIVVTADDEIRLRRLVERSGLGRDEAERRIRAQAPQHEKVAVADFVIDNSGSLEQTRSQVLRVWRAILRRSVT